MSVVYLPEDKRWELVGQGLGQLAGMFAFQKLKNWDDQRVAQGVRQIQDDQSIRPEDKPLEIQGRFGSKGLALAQALQKMNLEGLQAKHTVAETGLAEARTAAMPGQTERTAAETERARAGTALETSKLLMQPAELAHIQAGTVREQAGVAEAQAGTAEKQFGLQQKQAQAQALAKIMALSDQERTNAEAAGNLPAGTLNAAGLAGAIAGPAAAASAIGSGVRAQTSLEQAGPKAAARVAAEQAAKAGTQPLPTTVANTVANSTRLATGLGETLQSVIDDPKSQGGPSAFVKAFLTEHGFLTSDPMFAQQLANTHQLVAQAATSQGGFMSAQRIALAKTISPSVLKGKAYSVFEANAIANDTLAYLQNIKQNYGAQFNTKQFDDAIGQMQKIADQTSTLWSTKDGKTTFFEGKQVDPVSFKPIAGGSQEFKSKTSVDLGSGHTALGADVNARARAKGLTPEAYVAQLKIQLEGQ